MAYFGSIAENMAHNQSENVKTKIFLSYSRKDTKLALKIQQALVEQNFEVLIDREDIAPGEDWKDRLRQLIKQADALVFALSPHSAKSYECGWEVDQAQDFGKRILPAVIAKVNIANIPPALAKLNFIIFFKRSFELGSKDLVSALKTNLDWVRKHTVISEQALSWENQKQSRSQILRGSALLEAEKWLASQPADAATPTELQRKYIAISRNAAIWRQRNWVAGSVAVAVISAGLAIWGEVNRKEAVAQRGIAIEQRDKAERVLAAATNTSHGLVFDLAQKFRNVQGVPAETIRNILEKAKNLQDDLSKSDGTSPEMRRDQAAALHELSLTYQAQGLSQEAMDSALQAFKILDSLSKEIPENDEWRRGVAITLLNLGEVQSSQNKNEAAMNSFIAARDILKLVAQRHPENAQWQSNYAAALNDIGSDLIIRGKAAEGVEVLNQSQVLIEKLIELSPTDMELQQKRAALEFGIANAEKELGQNDEAIQHFNSAENLLSELAPKLPNDLSIKRDLYATEYALADIFALRGQTDAQIKFQRVLDYSDSLLQSDPQNREWQAARASALFRFGEYALERGLTADAERFLRPSISMFEGLTKADPKNTNWMKSQADAMLSWAALLGQQGQNENAVKAFSDAIENLRRVVAGERSNHVYKNALAFGLLRQATFLQNISDVIAAQNSISEAILLLREVANANAENATFRQRLAAALATLGMLQNQLKKSDDAEKTLNEALTLAQNVLGARPQDGGVKSLIAAIYENLGDLKYAQKQSGLAFDNYKAALDRFMELANADLANATLVNAIANENLSIGKLLIVTEQKKAALSYLHDSENLFEQLEQRQLGDTLVLYNFALCHELLALAEETPKLHLLAAQKITDQLLENDKNNKLAAKLAAQLKSELALLP